MRPSFALDSQPGVRQEIRKALEAHGLTNPRIFGSTSKGSDTESSDLDILVSKGSLNIGLLKLVRIEREISEILGVPVQIVTEETTKGHRWAKIIEESMSL
jgi:predicted nucleotidyltransferase